jgi:hypothetical protein
MQPRIAFYGDSMNRPRLRPFNPPAHEAAPDDRLRTAVDGSDSLEYMADLILQLRGMAERNGYAALGSILEVAYQEAISQARIR